MVPKCLGGLGARGGTQQLGWGGEVIETKNII